MSSAAPPLLRLSTDGVEPRLRPQLVGDVMARQLAGGHVTRSADNLWCDWQLAEIGPGIVLAAARQGGLEARRDRSLLRDGDDDLSIFFCHGGSASVEQNDRRSILGPGDAVVVAHGRPVSSTWPDTTVTVLRLPRAVFGRDHLIGRSGGRVLDRRAPAARLLAAYVAATSSLVDGHGVPPLAGRHLAELAGLALDEATGTAIPLKGRAATAARAAAMREAIALRLADPGLTMATVAAAVGVSERAGYLTFAAENIGFTDLVVGLRLDRAREALAAGYAGKIVDLALAVGFADLSHFNRRFRERFGVTPSELRRG